MKLDEIKEELEYKNNIKIEQISRLQKFDKDKKEKCDTESIIIEYGQDITFPLHMFLGNKRINVKQFIPYPTRCFKCQKFGHVSNNCRGKAKCQIVARNMILKTVTKKRLKNVATVAKIIQPGIKAV